MRLIDHLNRFTTKQNKGCAATFDQYNTKDYEQAFQKTLNIYEQTENSKSKITKIIDYKYHSIHNLNELGEKTLNDIKKQYVYELALKAWNFEKDVSYQHDFIIPFFDKEAHDLRIELEQPEVLKDSKISLVGFNFSIIQDFYIKHEIQ